MADTPDPAVSLEEIKERAKAAAAMDIDVLASFNGVSVGGVIAASALDVPRLVAAIEAALKLAGDWEREAARLEPSGADAVQPAGPGNYLVSGRIGAYEDCARELREVFRALTGQEDGSA